MLHPYFSKYRALMLAERRRRAKARMLRAAFSALACYGLLSSVIAFYHHS